MLLRSASRPRRACCPLSDSAQRRSSTRASLVASPSCVAAPPRSRPTSRHSPTSRPHTGSPRRVAALRHCPALPATSVASPSSVLAGAMSRRKEAGFLLLLRSVSQPRSSYRPLSVFAPRRSSALAANVASPSWVATPPRSRPTSRHRPASSPHLSRPRRVAALRLRPVLPSACVSSPPSVVASAMGHHE